MTKRIAADVGDIVTTDAEDLTRSQRAQLDKVLASIRAEEDKYANTVELADMRRIASRAATRTDKLNKNQVGRQMRAALGVTKVNDANTSRTRASWTRRNVSLIKTIGPEHFDRVEKAVRDGFAKGSSSKTIRKSLLEIPGVTQRRAALIARDQTASLNANLTKQRYNENGITKFTWQTADDERVRPDHENLDGQEFSLKTGAPGEGFPGQPIQCRCFPVPSL